MGAKLRKKREMPFRIKISCYLRNIIKHFIRWRNYWLTG